MPLLPIRVQPRSSRNRLEVEGQAVKVWTTAPPVEGEANKAVCELVAKHLKIAKSRVSVARGDTGRDKVLEVEGLTEEELWSRLRDLPN
jgi:uncharacterized protein (TIGR00251 family)